MGSSRDVDGRVLWNQQVVNEWYELGSPTYEIAVATQTVLEKTTDCFNVTLRLTYTETQRYQKYTRIYFDEVGVENAEYINKEEDTILFTKDFDFKFITGENLHNKIMEQQSTIQAAMDGYFKQEQIKTSSAGALNSLNITELKNWNPSG